MPVYLFTFGFETPTQHRNNAAHGWDDEDIRSVFIETDSADSALAWGREIAERFVQTLWRSRDEAPASWLAGNFSHWIETDADTVATAHASGVPCVRVGEHPAFGASAS